MSPETYSINGLQFSRPFRSLVQPHFQFLADAGVVEPVLFGQAIWQMDHLKAPERFNYLGRLHRSQVIPFAQRVLQTLSNPMLEVVPHAESEASQFNFRFGGKGLRVMLFHRQAPATPVVIAAAPTASAAAIMTPQQQIEVAEDYLLSRQNKGPDQPRPDSHAFRWLYG